MTLNFPVAPMRSLEGRVFYDDNNNGIREKIERGAQDVEIKTMSAWTLTDGEGKFLLKQLPPGEIELSITSPHENRRRKIKFTGSDPQTLQIEIPVSRNF